MSAAQQNQISRSYDYAHSHVAQDSHHSRRRMAHTWDSDDDDDSATEVDRERLRGGSLYTAEMEEERALAHMRAAIAAGKKVPSKEALASIEKLDIKDLNESDKCKSFHLSNQKSYHL